MLAKSNVTGHGRSRLAPFWCAHISTGCTPPPPRANPNPWHQAGCGGSGLLPAAKGYSIENGLVVASACALVADTSTRYVPDASCAKVTGVIPATALRTGLQVPFTQCCSVTFCRAAGRT